MRFLLFIAAIAFFLFSLSIRAEANSVPKVVLFDISISRDLPNLLAKSEMFSRLIEASLLDFSGLRVIDRSSRDIQLFAKGQKVISCEGERSCLLGIAAAMDSDYMVTASLEPVGDLCTVSLSVVEVNTGNLVGHVFEYGDCATATLIDSFKHVGQRAWPPKMEYAKRNGFDYSFVVAGSLPFGALATSKSGTVISLPDQVKGAFTIGTDLGYRFQNQIFTGAYVHYAFVPVAGCSNCSDVSATSVRAGLIVKYFFDIFEKQKTIPWVGLGSGWEWLSVSGKSSTDRIDPNNSDVLLSKPRFRNLYSGWEMVSINAGTDYRLGQAIIGPYFTVSFSNFATVDQTLKTEGQSSTLVHSINGAHEWVVIGVRFTY